MHFSELNLPALPPGCKATEWLDVTTRADGGVWRLPLLSVTGPTAGPTLVVTAAVHGDEYEGVEAIPQVFQQVAPAQLRGKLVMAPVCNVPAYEAATRSSPLDGLNLARVFPGDAAGTVTQRIAHWMREKLLRHADFYIDLHSGGVAYNIPTLIGYVHDAGELGQRSQAGARAFGAPVLWGHPLPVAPGRTVSAATDLGVPWLYTEAPGGGYARPEDVACFAQGVINVMCWLEMLDGVPQPRPMTHHLFGDGNLDQVIDATAAGFFRAEVNLLAPVSAGQRLGVVRDLFGQVVQEVIADQDGVVIMLRRFHRVHVGDGLAQITNVMRD
ncbi:MAG: M14 family metallopeptidase [Caldilineaceae bacterium]